MRHSLQKAWRQTVWNLSFKGFEVKQILHSNELLSVVASDFVGEAGYTFCKTMLPANCHKGGF